jgi:hypothetical protein
LCIRDLFVKDRGLERITVAIEDLKDLELVVAGRILDKKLFDKMLMLRNVKYKRHLVPSESLKLEASSDVMVGFVRFALRKEQIIKPQ